MNNCCIFRVETYKREFMNYLSPEIAAHAKHASKKSLAKLGVSCGIFQDCFDTDLKNVEELVDLKKSKNE